MKPGDLIRHKRNNLTGVVLNIDRLKPAWWKWENWRLRWWPWKTYDMIFIELASGKYVTSSSPEDWEVIDEEL